MGGWGMGAELHRDRRGGLRTPDGALERATGGGIDRLRRRHGGRPDTRCPLRHPQPSPGIGSASGAGDDPWHRYRTPLFPIPLRPTYRPAAYLSWWRFWLG